MRKKLDAGAAAAGCMRLRIPLLFGMLLLCACYSLQPDASPPQVSITHTNGGVISIDDRTDIHADGRVFTGHRMLWGKNVARRGKLSSGAMRELREVLDGNDFARAVESLTPLATTCGTMEEDTIAIRYLRPGGHSLGFCVNEREVSLETLRLIDQIEAPLIRELGVHYTTRAGAAARLAYP